jgi:hypothetical protein
MSPTCIKCGAGMTVPKGLTPASSLSGWQWDCPKCHHRNTSWSTGTTQPASGAKKVKAKADPKKVGCLVILALAVVGGTLGVVLGSGNSGTSSNSGSVGDHVIVDTPGVASTLAGTSRTKLDNLISALSAKDTVGVQQLITAGDIVSVDNCSTALVIDSAIGGETQVRISSDSGNPSNNDQALWINTEFAQKGTPAGC